MDLYHLHAEAEPTDRTAVEAVDHVTEEIARLEAAQDLIMETSGPEDERLDVIAERLGELDPDTFEVEAKILSRLGSRRAPCRWSARRGHVRQDACA